MSDITAIQDKFTAQIAAASDLRALDDIRVTALGKKGEVSMMMRGLGKMAASCGASHGRNGGYLFGHGLLCR